MSSDTVIRVENLSKQYRIGVRQQSYKTFREAIVDTIKAPLKIARSLLSAPGSLLSSTPHDTIWALKNVSFEVKKGEVVGIIGRNGAGKSTLLKVLSKITEPTEGRVELKGRVGSLLEVGTGFHPELTGHENIYLYGAILGMNRWEVTRKFDEIVAFAELEKFVDTPVKRYSSGMYMRLAFSVAAHLETEVMLVDEVLAVGDVSFQKKCIGKMSDISKQGRTVLFVSHNMNAISILCQHGMLLESGQLIYTGETNDAVQTYFQSITPSSNIGEVILDTGLGGDPLSIHSITLKDQNGNSQGSFPRSSNLEIEISGTVSDENRDLIIAIDVKSIEDVLLFRTHSFEQKESFRILKKSGPFKLRCILPRNLFPASTYRIGVLTAIAKKEVINEVYPLLQFEIYQDKLLGGKFFRVPGLLSPKCRWEREENAN